MSARGEGGSRRTAAYGLRLVDAPGTDAPLVASAGRWLLAADPSWPEWEVAYEPVAEGWASLSEHFDEERAVLRAHPDGRLTLDRRAGRSTLMLAQPVSPEGLVHPYLASTAAFVGHWMGRSPFHAGAFSVDGRVWGVLGDQEAGKSTTLMALHRMGVPVVSDDLLVVEGEHVWSGPRCLDLRRSTAEWFDAGRSLGRIGRRERWRVDLPDVEPALPFAGWVVLAWSQDVRIEALDAAGRLGALAANRAVRAPGVVPYRLLDLAARPAVQFGRPRDRAALTGALNRLLDELAGAKVS